MLKKLVSMLLICLPLNVMAESPTELIVYNWTDYLDEGVIQEFEQRFNAKVNQAYFESDDARNKMLFRTHGKGYDVILATGDDVDKYQKSGWILPLGAEKVPNLKYAMPRWVDAWPQTKEYAVPYLWGTTGIIYRSDLVKEEITSWKQLYEPEEYLKGKILVFDMHRSVIGLALKSLGYPFNNENMKELKEAEKLLLHLKPYVQAFDTFSLDETAGIVTGDTWMGQGWNGDALTLQELNPAIEYVVPKEGTELWVDYFVVSSQSKVPELAIQFVNFIQDPKINALSAEALSFATTNSEAKAFLSEEHLNNPIIYPDEATLANSEFDIAPSSSRVKRKFIMIWSKLTH
ncbi:spermidine/putrescine ABC transporter substrate-binding protein [Candidatus Albibeggiatoa sp. nov. NOAA]|uniref:ABC transporter substrate-binding protein n=1 Tax=Candidatus Albibeggiatoa sp. nov. NOAA TaxID=3162724 RepID=UPI0032FCB194|nr:spermidine/putrescine ABC transporter substrate-binding protein [Thiotrichaceae bacterium]